MSLTAKLAALNDADLSQLKDRIDALRADIQTALTARDAAQAAAARAGTEFDALLAELERHQRSAT
jgi:outer membrane murein-binding lipoprotein Lpp